jgi:hypothetical protein
MKKINTIQQFLVKSEADSRIKIKDLLNKYKCEENKYLIAGSWAIEIISKTKLQHSDIDLIFISTPSLYIDDATIEEEKCYGQLPLDEDYFEKTKIKSKLFGEEVFLPSLNFQIAMKIIGELNSEFTKRAQNQIQLLFENYPAHEENQTLEELTYIFRKTTPLTLNYQELSQEIINAIQLWKNNQKDESIKEIVKIHSIVNQALRKEFSRRGLDKEIKISEVDI